MSQLGNNDKMNEGASDVPQLCRNCCEFFGQKHNDFLCSKCYKDKCKAETQVNNLLNNAISIPQETVQVEKIVEEVQPKTEMIPEPVVQTIEEEKPKPVEKQANKCGKCPKKVSLLGYTCKCGLTFCKSHRLPEEHDCEFDFRQAAKERLAKENPNITASKLEKI